MAWVHEHDMRWSLTLTTWVLIAKLPGVRTLRESSATTTIVWTTRMIAPRPYRLGDVARRRTSSGTRTTSESKRVTPTRSGQEAHGLNSASSCTSMTLPQPGHRDDLFSRAVPHWGQFRILLLARGVLVPFQQVP
jgi:hypothetical protein